jgi:hypothetical protein
MRHLVPLVIVLAACSTSHRSGNEDDAGVVGAIDAEIPEFCECVQLVGDHWCGDYWSSDACNPDGTCQPGYTHGEECWCYGGVVGCECTPSGWDCDVDCPSDPSTLDGRECGAEGQTCPSQCELCGSCSTWVCEDNTWRRYEAPPPPECTQFACGPDVVCDAVTSYCEHAASDIGGEPDFYACRPYPSDGCRSCDCLPGDECEGDTSTGITITYYGG